MLQAIAIDDEQIGLEVIRSFSTKVSFINIAGYFTNAFEAMDFLKNNKIDLLFLDIKMPDISGIDFLKSLPNRPMVIFTTAYSEHAVQSFELDAIDYLLKPFALTRFLKACNKAYEQLQLRQNIHESPFIFIKSGYEQIRVSLNDIRYVESNGNYVQFVVGEQKKIISRLTMTEAVNMLPQSRFVRIHRFYIVSRDHVSKFDRKSVFIGNTELSIGSDYTFQ